MSTFRVTRRYVEMVPVTRTEVLVETEDPIEAHVVVADWWKTHRLAKSGPEIEGEHPTHEWNGARCAKCGSPRSGCIMSHLPCGENSGEPLIVAMDAWRAENAEVSR